MFHNDPYGGRAAENLHKGKQDPMPGQGARPVLRRGRGGEVPGHAVQPLQLPRREKADQGEGIS